MRTNSPQLKELEGEIQGTLERGMITRMASDIAEVIRHHFEETEADPIIELEATTAKVMRRLGLYGHVVYDDRREPDGTRVVKTRRDFTRKALRLYERLKDSGYYDAPYDRLSHSGEHVEEIIRNSI